MAFKPKSKKPSKGKFNIKDLVQPPSGAPQPPMPGGGGMGSTGAGIGAMAGQSM